MRPDKKLQQWGRDTDTFNTDYREIRACSGLRQRGRGTLVSREAFPRAGDHPRTAISISCILVQLVQRDGDGAERPADVLVVDIVRCWLVSASGGVTHSPQLLPSAQSGMRPRRGSRVQPRER